MTPTLVLDAHRGRLAVEDRPMALVSDVLLLRVAQLVHDVLGPDAEVLWMRQGRRVAHDLLASVWRGLPKVAGPRLQAARTVFAWAGEGRFAIENDEGRRRAIGLPLLESHAVARLGAGTGQPADAYAGGWIVGAFEGVLMREAHTLATRQTACRSLGAPRCEFDFMRAQPIPGELPPLSDAEIAARHPAPAVRETAPIERLHALLWQENADRFGLRPVGGHLWALRPIDVLVTAAEVAYAALPDDAAIRHAFRNMLREAARVEVLTAWDAVIREQTPDLSAEDWTAAVVAMAAACGRGHWTLVHNVDGTLTLAGAQLPELDAQSVDAPTPLGEWLLAGAALACVDALQQGPELALTPPGRRGSIIACERPTYGEAQRVLVAAR